MQTDQKHTESSPQTAHRRVLIVEDDDRLREMLLRALRAMEFEPASAASAEEALDVLSSSAFGILIVDLNLPVMDGLEFCHRVRSLSADSQIIILTGFGTFDAARDAIRMDVVDFLTKPCSLADIEVALDRALRRRLGEAEQKTTPEHRRFDEEQPDSSRAQKLQDHERDCILQSLARNRGNREATAEELGISVRTLYYRLNMYEQQGYICR